MTIQLDNWRIQEINYSLLEIEIPREQHTFDLKTGNVFSEEDSNIFGVVFNVGIKDRKFDLAIKAVYWFTLDDKITEEFKLSPFPKINAPAIAFPYLRAFISNLTLQSGIDPVILPSLNFIKIAEK
jgi:preprotein translocase subunit SecB